MQMFVQPGGFHLQLYMQLYRLVLALMGLEFVDADGRAAGRLPIAARAGHLEVVRLLCEPGSDGHKARPGGDAALPGTRDAQLYI
jgi:hypothetical protein